MVCVDLINIWLNIFKDLCDILVFTNVFTLDVPDSHTWVQGIVDHDSCCHINLVHLNGFLVGLANMRVVQFAKFQGSKPNNIGNHLLVKAVELGKVNCILF
jgi:hypothetical protein